MTESNGSQRSVGDSPPRVDGTGKVTGAALYVDDLPVPGAWHGRTVRSTVPHGILRAIRLDADFDWSQVVVVTAEDIPGRNLITLIVDDQPALVPLGGTIRHVEEAVAVVVAPTRAAALEASRHVTLEVDALPSIHDLDAALAAAVRLHGDDNVQKRLEIHRDDADIDAVLAACDHVVEGVYTTGAQEQMYIETQGMVARWEDGRCHVVGSLQCPYYVHTALKPLLALGDDEVIVGQAVTGGGFGGKEEYPSMLAAHAALASLKTGRPVKLIYDRGEDIAVTTKRHPARVRHRLGLRADGTLVAADVDVLIDGGAYVTLSPVVLSRAILHATGPYRIPHVRVVGRSMATNTPPHGAFRGFGAPQTTFAYERQMAKAAVRVGMDPIAFRRHNLLRDGDTTATGQVLSGSVGSDAVVDALEQALEAEPPTPATRFGTLSAPVRRGRGLAVCFHGAGFTGSGEARLMGRATVAALPTGGFEVRSSSTDIGQGALTIFTQIAAQALGVDPVHVHIAQASTDRVPDSGPTVASRTCMVVGRVVEQAATALRERLETWGRSASSAAPAASTASTASAPPTAPTPAPGTAAGAGAHDVLALARRHLDQVGEVAETRTYEPPAGVAWDDDTYTGSAYPVFGWAACLVDLAVDEDSLEVTVERCLHAIDVGRAIHPRIVKGQIEGGTLQALGWALWESVPYADGRVANPSMTDCIIPTSSDAPELETILVEVPYAYGPHGAKGVGEIPMDGPAAAVASALEQALGVACDELPLLPEVLQRLVAQGGAASIGASS